MPLKVLGYSIVILITLAVQHIRSDVISSIIPTTCVSGGAATAFSTCDYMLNVLETCGDSAPCLCNQALFDSFYGCEAEFVACKGNDDIAIVAGEVPLWHSICDSNLTFSLTTPPNTFTRTKTLDADACTSAFSVCNSVLAELSSCSNAYESQTSKFSSCYCAPELLSLDYSCAFAADVLCGTSSALALTTLAPYSVCPNFMSVVGGLPTVAPNAVSTQTATNGSSAASSSYSLSITMPAVPGGSSTSTGPVSTSTTTNSASITVRPNQILGLLCFVSLLLSSRLIEL